MSEEVKKQRGGKRAGAGRRKKQVRVTDSDLAGRILAKAKAEEKWLELLGSDNEHIVLRALEYLTDRHEGKAQQKVQLDGNLTLDLAARRERIRDLISRLAGKA